MNVCTQCGSQMEEQATLCSACGYQHALSLPPKKRKGKSLLLILSTLLVVSLLSGYFTHWFGFTNPMKRLTKAIENTLLAKSFTMNIQVKGKSSSGTTYNQEQILYYMVDPQEEKLTLFLENTEEENSQLLYNQVTYVSKKKYAYTSQSNTETFFKIYNNYYNHKKIDWNTVIKEADLEDSLKPENMDSFMTAFEDDYFYNTQWLRSALEFTRENGVYTFTPNYKNLYRDLTDLGKQYNVFTDYALEEMEKDDDAEQDLAQMQQEEQLSLSFSCKGNYLSQVIIKTKDGESTQTTTLTFSQINATYISQKEIETYVNDVEKREKEDQCPICGRIRYGSGNCYSCNKTCAKCGTYAVTTTMTEDNGSYYCSDCCTTYCGGCGKKLPLSAMYHKSYPYSHYRCYSCYYNN